MKIFNLSILIIFILTIFIVNKGVCMETTNLTQKEQNIVYISSYTAKGDMQNLEKALNKALDDKLTIYETKEILVQMYAYCGFPRCLNALTTLMRVTDERSANNNYDEYGVEPTELPSDSNKLDIGTAVQTKLVGTHVTGRLFEFEPAIDKYLKEHLFADIFSRGVLSYEEREIATIAALSSLSDVEPQLKAHIQIAQNIGVPQSKIDDILKITEYNTFKNIIFERGNKNDAYAQYFVGQSYLKMLNSEGMNIANVTFEPGCRNNWHIHHKGGQILMVIQGRGYYQEWGKPARELHAGDVVNIPAEVKHWHGAAKDSWFVHVAIEVPTKSGFTEWLEPVDNNDYNELK